MESQEVRRTTGSIAMILSIMDPVGRGNYAQTVTDRASAPPRSPADRIAIFPNWRRQSHRPISAPPDGALQGNSPMADRDSRPVRFLDLRAAPERLTASPVDAQGPPTPIRTTATLALLFPRRRPAAVRFRDRCASPGRYAKVVIGKTCGMGLVYAYRRNGESRNCGVAICALFGTA